jgi:hypothetical protein
MSTTPSHSAAAAVDAGRQRAQHAVHGAHDRGVELVAVAKAGDFREVVDRLCREDLTATCAYKGIGRVDWFVREALASTRLTRAPMRLSVASCAGLHSVI